MIIDVCIVLRLLVSLFLRKSKQYSIYYNMRIPHIMRIMLSIFLRIMMPACLRITLHMSLRVIMLIVLHTMMPMCMRILMRIMLHMIMRIMKMYCSAYYVASAYNVGLVLCICLCIY